jgi:gas vesicle protein
MSPLHAWLNHYFGDPTVALVVGLMGGGLIGYVISWWFARSSTKELRNQVKALRAHVELPARMLEAQGQGQKVTLNRNKEGEVTGLVHHASLQDGIQTSVKILGATLTTVKTEDLPPGSK